ncbi:MAG TPA: NAD(P)-dependent oxidoreductase, partial [Candidatus Paceibacterota bacterium]|nr:NAD(P)-dependent oxidoreductase [Candidatus Paceibacterota bacterium]
YKGWDPMGFIGMDTVGKTLAIVGAGRIGGQLAHYAHGLGMTVIYTDVARNEKIEQDCGAEYVPTLEALLPRADVISLHVPLMDSTHHLINENHLSMMKPTAYLINTSRGPVVDERALVKALSEKKIAGAGLDVFEFEPKLSPGLARLDNVILTPHTASASKEAREEMATIAAQNILDFLEGKTPRNILNQ